MPPLTKVHRNIEIRYGYDIVTDSYRAHFDLPEDRRRQPEFQRVVHTNLSKTIEPGKRHVDGQSESEVLTQARSVIDDYLGEE